MKLAIISGSPKKEGNCNEIASFIEESAKKIDVETTTVLLSNVRINPCIACGYCKKENSCSIKDEMEMIREILSSCDGVIFISPVYFGGVSSQIKMVIDRTIPLRRNGFLLKNKVGAAIAIGGSRNGGQELTIYNIHSFMHIHGMIVVGDNSHFGGIAVNPFSDDIEGRKTILDTLYKVIDTIKIIRK